MIQLEPEEIHQMLKESSGSSQHPYFHEFHLKTGEKVYLQAAHVVSIEGTRETTSLTDSLDEEHISDKGMDTAEENKDQERKDNNLDAAKSFKKDLDGNME
ncbi:hypothetical protein [Marinilactibacillus piezotolerans]|uniref:hypothetical protein n=1 Tax=Marinilactibacillus piezotolerans TaxID=258723 RepID=UPI0009B019FB|nr:hypothetical protein [Marinilactibacillus piezotolerans]